MVGTITRILPNKGYAFIRGEDGLPRFAHAREFVPRTAFDRAYEGQRVNFTPADDGPKDKGDGLRAVQITCLN